MSKLSILAVAVAVLACVASANAGTVIFNDSFQTGFANGQWDTYIRTNSVHSGTSSLEGSAYTCNFSPNAAMGANTTIEFYVNTLTAVTKNYLITLTFSDNVQIAFDNRNIPTHYIVDGVDLAATATGITSDADTATWQKVSVDLTQQCWQGWPYTASRLVTSESVIKSIRISGGTGSVVDDISLVPEPATMSLLGLGLFGLLRRRR